MYNIGDYLANLKQSKKRARQDLKKRAFNKINLSIVKNSIKKYLRSIKSGDLNSIFSLYSDVVSKIDKGAAKGVIHKNKASRIKSRLNSKFMFNKGM